MKGMRMKGACLAVGLLALSPIGGEAAFAAAAGESRFSVYIDDLPVMPGLSETEDGYNFDIAQGGRMAETRMSGAADVRVVRSFYAATLPQLGWTPTGPEPYIYRRGRERLTFRVDQKRGGLTAVFAVTPEAQAAPVARSR